MMTLKAEQQRLYALMPAEARCFVRISDRDDALWVSDLPRRLAACDELAERLRQAGYEIRLDSSACLWLIDWTTEKWRDMLTELPEIPPAFPGAEELHEAYALCRLLMRHPSPLQQEHLPMLRRVLKLTAQPGEKLLRSVRPLHEEAAVMLRMNKSIPHAAGRVLSAWLMERINGKEKLP